MKLKYGESLQHKNGEPIINDSIIEALDKFIEARLAGVDSNSILSVTWKDSRVRKMYPEDWPPVRVAKSFAHYINLRRDRWDILHHKKVGRYDVQRKPEVKTK